MTRFHDSGTYESEFQREFAVRCPKCESRAYVFSDAQGWRAKSAKVSCASCGYSAFWSAGKYKRPAAAPISKLRRAPCDPYFGYALWFTGEVKGNVFWAYNAAHLAFIRQYVEATLRIREPNRNSSLASRLPQFLLDRKNRGAVLKEIATMERE